MMHYTCLHADGDHTFGQLLWKDDWVTFLDGFLQLALQGMHNGRMLKMPTRIHSVIIDPQLHVQTIVQEGSKQGNRCGLVNSLDT